MDSKRDWYIRVFGVELGWGAEAEISRRVGKVKGVLNSSWHEPSQGLCVKLDAQGDVAHVTNELRRLGYVPLAVHDACACCLPNSPEPLRPRL